MQACYNSNTTALNCIAQAQILKADHLLHGGQKLGQRQVAEHAGLPPPVIPMFGGSQVPSSGPAPVYTTRPALIILWLWAMAERFCSLKRIIVFRKWNLLCDKCERLCLGGKGPLSLFLMAVPSLPALGSAKNLCSGNTLLTLEDSGNTHW